MKADDILSSELVLRWDEELKSLIVINPNLDDSLGQLIRIREETLLEMNFEQAIAFIGSRVALLMPQLRSIYIDSETGEIREDGSPNKSSKRTR